MAQGLPPGLAELLGCPAVDFHSLLSLGWGGPEGQTLIDI